MNRFLASLGIALFLTGLILAFAPVAKPLQPGRASIRITQQRISHSTNVRDPRIGRIVVDTFHLYNRRVRRQALGSSIIFCTYLGKGGIRGSGAQWCNANFTLPKGSIVAVGIQRSPFFYNLSVVGGTGVYANVIGTVLISQLTIRHFNLIFALQAL